LRRPTPRHPRPQFTTSTTGATSTSHRSTSGGKFQVLLPQKFDSYRECLTNIGVEPGKDADTILAQLDERGLDARKCVEEGTPNG